MEWIFVGAIAYLILAGYIAKVFQDIAQVKGHEERRYFWWIFLLGPVGMMMVIALPDLYARPSNQPTITVQPIKQPPQSQPNIPKYDELDDKLPEL